MFGRREFPCFDAVAEAAASVARQAALLQNLAEYADPEAAAHTQRRMHGLAAAVHRDWRELNERLARQFVTAVEREDVSALVREMAELAAQMATLAVLWQVSPPASAAAWAKRLATGGSALRALVEELPRLWQDNTLADRAEALYALRREADAAFEQEARRLHGAALVPVAAAHACCVALARLADTAEWLALKNQ